MDLESSIKSMSISTSKPNKVLNFAAFIGENHTEFVLSHFTNYHTIIITQFEKIGNLYQIRIDQPDTGISISEPVYTITPILGGDNIEAEAGARYITEKLKIRKPLLLCLSLKDYTRNTLRHIVQAIDNYKP